MLEDVGDSSAYVLINGVFTIQGSGRQDKLSWLQRFYGMTPFSSNPLSFSPSLSPNVIPLSSFFFSPEQLEGQSGKRGMCEHALWGWGEGVREKKWEIKREWEMGGKKMRGRPVLIGLCGHAGLWWCSLAKPCLNSWPGLTCIPCIRPTTTNSSVLFGSFQCQAWESCATHIYALHFRRPLLGGCEGSFGFVQGGISVLVLKVYINVCATSRKDKLSSSTLKVFA